MPTPLPRFSLPKRPPRYARKRDPLVAALSKSVSRLLPPERREAISHSPILRKAVFVLTVALVGGVLLQEVVFKDRPTFGGTRRWTDAALLDGASGPLRAGSDAAPGTGGALLPAAPGARWLSKGAAADGAPLTLQMRVVRAGASPDGTVDAVYESRFLQRMRRPRLLTEVYRSGPAGIFGVSTGEKGEVRLEPPLPLVRMPLRPGAFETWRGHLLPPGSAPIPATAVCRIDGPDRVTTPAGSFRAYRLDMQVRIGPDPDQAPPRSSTIFLAPGIGFVRQEIGQMTGVSTLELERFTPAPHREAAQ